jgi:hypothetical protein
MYWYLWVSLLFPLTPFPLHPYITSFLWKRVPGRARESCWCIEGFDGCLMLGKGKTMLMMRCITDQISISGKPDVESDCVLGHEAAGIVLKVGEGVKDFVVGELLCLFFSAPLFSSFSSALILVSLSFSSSLLSFLGRGWFRKVLFIVCTY